MARAYIGLGSNLGDRMNYLINALYKLEKLPGLEIIAVSPIYETEPVGGPLQDRFLNCCVSLYTDLLPSRLLQQMLLIEEDLGRKRKEVWGPRTIDLDLLIYEEIIMRTPLLDLPHPYLVKRKFVLVPLSDLAPGLIIPGTGKTVVQFLQQNSHTKSVKLYQTDWYFGSRN